MTAEQVTFLVAAIVIGANLGWLLLFGISKSIAARSRRERAAKRSKDTL